MIKRGRKLYSKLWAEDCTDNRTAKWHKKPETRQKTDQQTGQEKDRKNGNKKG